MKGVGMNMKSNILKLTLLTVLVLVLIPVVAAENSTDTFYIEYDVGDDEVCIEEYQNFDNIQDDAQVKSSSDNEIDLETDGSNINIDKSSEVDKSFDYVDDKNIIADYDSALEPHDIVSVENNCSLLDDCADFSDVDFDVNESSDDGFTVETDYLKESLFTVPNFKILYIIDNFLDLTEDTIFCQTCSFNMSNSARTILKNLELKESLLNDNFAVVYYMYANGVVVIQVNGEDFNNKNLGDFVYSIDNSIIGSEAISFVFLTGSFLNTSFSNNNFYMNDYTFFEHYCCELILNKFSKNSEILCFRDSSIIFNQVFMENLECILWLV